MKTARLLYNILLDALFPRPSDEASALSLTPEAAFAEFPKGSQPPFSNMRSVFAYKDPRVRKLIWSVKYKRDAQAIQTCGYALYSTLRTITDSPLYIVPMPITLRRRNERGYNQCELLVEEIARLDSAKRIKIISNLLLRIHHTERQTLKDREERLHDAKGIFAVDSSYQNLFFARIIVIDDVVTTGSTMNEAIGTMKKAGFQNVTGLSVAH